MPTDISIQYISDFGQAVTSSASGKVWVEWSMTNGNAYYTGSPPGALTVDSTTQFSIALTRSGAAPVVGDYAIVLNIKLWYHTAETDFKMDEVDYTFNVNIAGAASSTIVSTGSGATTGGSFNAPSITENSVGNGSVVSAAPSISLAQSGSNVAVGSDVILLATTASGTHTLWVVPTDPVIASGDTTFDESDYEWPNPAVASDVTSETGTQSTVTIHLKSVPVEVFDLQTIYIRLTVHYRDISHDFGTRRALRRSLEGGHTAVLAREGGAVDIVGKVTFGRAVDSGSVATSVFTIISTTAVGAGAALLI